MNKVIKTTLFTSLMIFAFALQANESDAEDNSCKGEGNVIVDSRPLSPQTKALMEKNRKYETELSEELVEDDEELSSLIIPIKEKEPMLCLASSEPKNTADYIPPYPALNLAYFPQENIVKTKDGSEWIFDKTEAHIVFNWRQDDHIIVSPKGRWFWGSNYSYVLTNKDRGTSIDVNLFLGPVAYGERSNWIIGINHNNNQIFLIDGLGKRTTWEISSIDRGLFKEWEINDTLIIGQNDSWYWWLSSYNHILINVNMNHYVRARQIS